MVNYTCITDIKIIIQISHFYQPIYQDIVYGTHILKIKTTNKFHELNTEPVTINSPREDSITTHISSPYW